MIGRRLAAFAIAICLTFSSAADDGGVLAAPAGAITEVQQSDWLELPADDDPMPAKLLTIAATKPAECELEVLGWQDVADPGEDLLLVKTTDAATIRWTIKRKIANTIGAPTAVGVFSLADGALSFGWTAACPALRECLLNITADGKGEIFALRPPVELSLTEADAAAPNRTPGIDLPLSWTAAEQRGLQLQVDAGNLKRCVQRPQGAVGIGEAITLTTDFTKTHRLEVELGLRKSASGGHARLEVSTFVVPVKTRGAKPALGGGREAVSLAAVRHRKHDLLKEAKDAQQRRDNVQKEFDRQTGSDGKAKRRAKKPTRDLNKSIQLMEKYQNSLNAATASIERCDEFEAVMQALASGVRISLHYEIESQRIVLAETNQEAPRGP